MRIAELCTRHAVFIGAGACVREAAELMRAKHVGALVVTTQPNGERVPIGIVTDRDIVVAVVAAGVDAATLAVDDIMTRDVATCGEDQDLLDVIGIMRQHGVRRLPVLNAKGGLAGVVAADDIYDAIGIHMHELSRALTREQVRERQKRS